MSAAVEHRECRKVLRRAALENGTEVEVSVVPLLPMDGPYPPERAVCPHRVEYWIQPTARQIERWGTS